ncbi:MAG: carbohydrate-binding domain-containing protein [Oscillospiraceae bacterium]|nr:carbohydrate-binding domain-containing protein [Oscillospiraceae bacterium]
MKKKMLAALMVAVLAFSMLGATAFAQTDVDLGQQDGKLLITEPGSYVLQGKLTGCVTVDPGQGEVELILDGVDIDGSTGAGIIALSGDKLTVTLPEGAVNRVIDGGADAQFDAAIYSKVDTVFEGNGALYVTGNFRNGIRAEKADLTFNGGSYAIKAQNFGISARTLTVNDGHFSIQAPDSIDPAARLVMNGGFLDEVAPVDQAPAAPAESAQNMETAPAQDAQAPEMPSDNFDGQQPPEMPSGSFDGQQAPEMPSDNFDGQQPPEMPSGSFDGQQPPEMPGEMQQPGQQTALSSADSATEVVSGTMTNSAASLEADYANATYITVTDDDSQVTIKSSGTYVVTGSSSDGNITVKKGTTGVVLVLDDLDLTSTTGATVSINKEAEVKIIISGTVTLTDNENPDDENSTDEAVADAFDGAALKAKANSQVYVTGDGTLVIHGNAKNGIKAGDDSSLIFDGVTVNIDAANDGINGNYDVSLLSGSFTIAAGDDAIHADHILSIGNTDGTGPTIRVTESTEGLEGTVVNIYGGDLSIVSSDDAINAANGDGLYEGVLDYSFNMMGGRLVINSQGDGIDSNGNVNLIGGSAEIHSGAVGGEAGIDYDGQLYVGPDFQMNNQSGTAGPDGMGGMPGQMGGMPGQMGGQQPGMGGQMPGGGFSNMP